MSKRTKRRCEHSVLWWLDSLLTHGDGSGSGPLVFLMWPGILGGVFHLRKCWSKRHQLHMIQILGEIFDKYKQCCLKLTYISRFSLSKNCRWEFLFADSLDVLRNIFVEQTWLLIQIDKCDWVWVSSLGPRALHADLTKRVWRYNWPFCSKNWGKPDSPWKGSAFIGLSATSTTFPSMWKLFLLSLQRYNPFVCASIAVLEK